MTTILNKIIEEQVKKWEHDNLAKTPRTPKGKPFPVLTVSREYGAQGATLAKQMSEKLGFKIWDKEILQVIAEKLGSDKKYLGSLDENRRKTIEDMVVGFLNKSTTNTGYIRTLNEVVSALEDHGNSVIVGRGANYICTDPKSFHLRLVSPLKVRKGHIAAKEGISKSEAQIIINKMDEERSAFVRHHFKKDVSNSSDYDLVLNSGVFTLDDMMEIVMLSYEKKTGLKLSLQK